MQKLRTFISSLLRTDFSQNSTLQAKECKNIKPLSVRSKKLIISITLQVTIIRPKRLRSRNFENHAAYDVVEVATEDPGH